MQKWNAIILCLVVSLSFGGIGYLAGYLAFDQGHLHYLAAKGVYTQAFVSAKDRDNHQSIRYVYEVGGERFEGSGLPEGADRRFDEVNLKDQIPVLYDPANPSDSFLGDPQDLAASNEPLIFIVSLAFAGIGFVTSLPFFLFFGRMRSHN
jgi:hypothetical protein